MQTDSKILLTIKLEGVLGSRSEKKDVIPYNVKSFNGEKLNGVNYHYPRMSKECVKKTTLSVAAYEYFISEECPSWMHKKRWKKLSQNERLVLHLGRIAEGNEFSFEILHE